jgi:ABC-type antimicrobial peptide transport system permease subunit
MGLQALGACAGALLAAPPRRALASALYGVSLADPVAWGIALAILALAAAAANGVPALRASRVNPSTALRSE